MKNAMREEAANVLILKYGKDVVQCATHMLLSATLAKRVAVQERHAAAAGALTDLGLAKELENFLQKNNADFIIQHIGPSVEAIKKVSACADEITRFYEAEQEANLVMSVMRNMAGGSGNVH